jgi:hypothetical protein
LEHVPRHSHHRHPVKRWLHRYGWTIAVVLGGILLGAVIARVS